MNSENLNIVLQDHDYIITKIRELKEEIFELKSEIRDLSDRIEKLIDVVGELLLKEKED